MKRIRYFYLITFILFSFLIVSSKPGNAEENTSTLTVEGHGKVSVTPDIAYLNFSIETIAPKASTSVKENAVKTNKVLNSLKSITGKEGKIESVSYSLFPIYEYIKYKNKSVITGYKAVNSFEVEVKNLEKLGHIIDSITENGVNVIREPHFDTTKRTEYRRKALELAIKDACKTAETISKAAGVKLVKIRKIQPTYSITFPKRNFSHHMALAAEADKPTPIEKGDLLIDARVTITYEIN